MSMRESLKVATALALGTAAMLSAQTTPIRWPLSEPATHGGFPEILVSTEWLAAALKEQAVVVLDARERKAYEAGHVPGALSADLGAAIASEGPAAVRSQLGALGITGSETVVLYAEENAFEAVGRAYWLLESAGQGNVRILAGGIEAWKHENRVDSTAATTTRQGKYVATDIENSVNVTVDWLRDRLGQQGVELIDLRGTWEAEGYRPPPRYAAGHLPTSLPYSFLPDFADEADWPDPAAVRDRLGRLGPRPGDFVNLYATFVLHGEDPNDPQLGLAYLLLRMAGVDVRVFSPGFELWRQGEAVVRELATADLESMLLQENPTLAQDRRPQRLIFIDLRESRDYSRLGHLPGAYNLPFRTAGFGELFEAITKAFWSEQPRDSVPVVLYCYGPDCVRSRKASAVVSRRGFNNIFIYRGGPIEWEAEGHPLFESLLVE